MIRTPFAMLLAAALAGPVAAQTYPTKPPRLFVGFVPGGGVDQTARIAAAKLSEIWGQQITVENRVGAGGTVAADATAKSPPDGYTLVLCNIGSHGIAPSLYKKLAYDAIRDVTHIGLIGTTPNVMVVNNAVPATTVAEFIAYAKANPGKINMASSGTGTSIHLSGELFKAMTGVDMLHVPYRGSAPAVTDLLAGQVQVMFDNLPSSMQHIKSGGLRALGVTTAKRLDVIPDVPAIGETVAGYEASGIFGLTAPKGTPREIVDLLNKQVNAALADPKIKERLIELGGIPLPTTPDEFGKIIADETAKWAKVVTFAGASVD